jgi:nucleoside-diphosphate-sugar epimerase
VLTRPLLVLGCGYTGTTVARRALAQGRSVVGTVRTAERAQQVHAALRADPELDADTVARHFTLITAPALDASVAQHVTPDTDVVIAFPPDGSTDARVAPALAAARSVTYVSSTGVYGGRTGKIDDTTPLPMPPSERAQRILDAEAHYRAVGATVLRCPGIYGAARGLHLRILRGEHRIPGDGSRTLSRIHVEDLASFALAAADRPGELYVIGDREPAPHGDVVVYVCETYGAPLPASIPWDQVHESLRADRAIDPTRALRELRVTLRFPSYREGMSPAATGLAARS